MITLRNFFEIKFTRILRLFFYFIGTFLLTLIAIIFWVLFTETGTKSAWHAASPWVAKWVEIDQISGYFAKAIKIENIRILAPQPSQGETLESTKKSAAPNLATINSAEFRWNPFSLIQKKLSIENIELDKIELFLAHLPAPPEEKKLVSNIFKLPQLNLSLDVALKEILIHQITLINTNQEDQPKEEKNPKNIQLNDIKLAAALKNNTLNIQEFQIKSNYANIQTEEFTWNKDQLISAIKISGINSDAFPEKIRDLQVGNQINLSIITNFTYGKDIFTSDRVEIRPLALTSSLQQEPVQLNFSGTYNGTEFIIDELTSTLRASKIQASGKIFSDIESIHTLNTKFDIPDLSSWLPTSQGKITGKLDFTGNLSHPVIQSNTKIVNLQYENFQIKEATLKASSENTRKIKAELNATEIKNLDNQIDLITINFYGDAQSQDISIHANHQLVNLDLTAKGKIQNQESWLLTLNQVTISPKKGLVEQIGNWELEQPFKTLISKEQLTMDHHCWQQSNTPSDTPQLCLSASKKNQSVQAKIQAKIPDITHFTRHNPKLVNITGDLNSDIKLTGSVEKPKVNADIHLKGGPIEFLSKLQLTTNQQDKKISGTVKTNIPDLNIFTSLNSNLKNLTGRLNSDIQLAGNLETPEISGNIKLSGGRIELTDSNQNKDDFITTYSPGNINLDIKNNKLLSNGHFIFDKIANFDFNFELTDIKNTPLKQPINGKLIVSLDNLDFLPYLSPELEAIDGKVSGKVNIKGTLTQPDINGYLRLVDSRVKLEKSDAEISELNLEVTASNQQPIQFKGSAKSGKGKIQLDGFTQPFSQPILAQITIKGDQFLVVDNNNANIEISPDLSIKLNENHLAVTGIILVPKANITPKKANKNKNTAINISDDQIIVTPELENPTPKKPPIKISSDIRLELGDKVKFKGFGLESGLAGQLRIIETGDKNTQATGELRITDGRFRAYGQDLQIQKGRVIFASSQLTQPGIDLNAVRIIDDTTEVGIEVRGLLKSPNINLYSSPAMSQSEQLSYLVLGRPLNETSEQESSVFNKAALAMGLKGGNYLAEKFGGKLGVDEIGIDTAPGENAEQAALSIGKYLSPRLYISYGVGIFEPVSTVKVRYKISTKWRFISESSGDTSGGDFIYVIERGE